jgi:hypothetical protein
METNKRIKTIIYRKRKNNDDNFAKKNKRKMTNKIKQNKKGKAHTTHMLRTQVKLFNISLVN